MLFRRGETRHLLRAQMISNVSLIAALIWTAGASGAEVWTLRRALEYAAANNPDARIAEHRIAMASASLGQANSAFWPKAQIQSSYSRTDNPMMAFGNILNQRAFDPSLQFNSVPEMDNINVRGLITAPIYAGGRSVAERNAAKANRQASRLEKIAALNQLELEVTRTFLAIHRTGQLKASVQATVHAFETNLVVSQRRFENGSALKADVLDMEVRLAEAREHLVRARNAGLLAEHALKNLLGIESDEPISVDASLPQLSVPGNVSLERPELLALGHRVEAARSRIRGAKSGHLPRVNAFGNVDYDYGTITRGDGTSYAAGVVAYWDLWDGFSTRSKINEARAGLESIQEEARKVRLEIDFERMQGRLNLLAAKERLAASEKAVAQAAESVKLTRDRFAQGLALSSQLIDAETALLAAKVRRAEAESDEQLAIASLRKALALPQLEETPD